jgi:hypothetical protein
MGAQPNPRNQVGDDLFERLGGIQLMRATRLEKLT